jgi:hypothetical protein
MYLNRDFDIKALIENSQEYPKTSYLLRRIGYDKTKIYPYSTTEHESSGNLENIENYVKFLESDGAEGVFAFKILDLSEFIKVKRFDFSRLKFGEIAQSAADSKITLNRDVGISDRVISDSIGSDVNLQHNQLSDIKLNSSILSAKADTYSTFFDLNTTIFEDYDDAEIIEENYNKENYELFRLLMH